MFYRHITWHNITSIRINHFGKLSTICIHYSFYSWKLTRYYQCKMIGFNKPLLLLAGCVLSKYILVICCVSLNTEERLLGGNVYPCRRFNHILTNRFPHYVRIVSSGTGQTGQSGQTGQKVKLTQALTLKGDLDS